METGKIREKHILKVVLLLHDIRLYGPLMKYRAMPFIVTQQFIAVLVACYIT